MMKSVLPWVLIVALLGGAYFLYSSGREKDAQLAKLEQDSQELAQVRAENEELKKIPLQKDELDRLRKEHDELLRLRNESQRLHDEVKRLNKQMVAAQEQNQKVQEAQQQAALLANENQNLRSQAAQRDSEAKLVQVQYNTCLNYLRQIDGAKQEWALENKKTADAVPTPQDLAPYLQNPGQIMCPAGGTYTINAVGVPPTCSVPSHVIPK